MRVAPILTSFNAGEWSPRLYGRVDLQKYPAALRQCKNFIGLPSGALMRRPGTKYVANTKGDAVARLIPFEFSTIQAYMIEATDLTFRFYKDLGIIESSPGVPLELTTVYTLASLPGLKWAQSADTMYIVSPSFKPYKLTRTGHTSWTITAVSFLDGPYLAQNTTATTLTPSATTGSVTVTASSTTGINSGTGFQTTDIGRKIRILTSGVWGWGTITARTSTTVVTMTVSSTLGGTGAVATWRLGAWSDTTGWPSAVSFFQERLCFANTTNQPQTVWMSKSGDYENFEPTTLGSSPAAATLDDNGITLTISDDRVNAIRWMSAGRQLVVGTVGGEFTIGASSNNEAITPSNAVVKRETTRGCADIQPVRIGQSVLFVQRAERKLFEMAYNYEVDAQVAPEMTLLADHLFRSQIKEVAYQPEPWSVLWACRDDGMLLSFVYLRDQSVTGWAQHPIGGSATDNKVLSVAVIAGTGQDELWLVVERTVSGATVRHVEYMTYEFYPADENDKDDAFFVDAGLTYDGVAADVMTGLDHLEGKTVHILADGAAHPTKTVASGSVTLDREAAVVHIGLGYTSTMETMDLEFGAPDGTAQGRRRRIHQLGVKFWATLGANVGREGSMDAIEFRSGSDAMDESPPLFTGDKRIMFPPGWDTEMRVIVTQEQPLPCTIVGLVPHMNTND